MTKKKPVIICVLGPTASGKSDTAFCVAKSIGGEIVSCDSMQIYKGMEILTQAPDKEMLSRIPHHLVGIVPPSEEFSAARFSALAEKAIEGIISRSKVPVLSGGTGLYAKVLIEGIFSSPNKDIALRENLEKEAAAKGNMHVYNKLKKIDPEAALRIDPKNIRRVIRALEVFELTGKKFSEKISETKGIGEKYEAKLFALDVPRNVLVERINARVEKMFNSGVVDEVKCLIKGDVGITASKALGIEEIKQFIAGKIGIEETKEKIKIKTRQYAKRQMTWLRAVKNICWISGERPAREIALDIARLSGFSS